MKTREVVLAARGLVVRYGAETAVRGIDITVGRGEVVGLIGPDGAGKTSTLRVAGGLLRAGAGEVTAFGRPVWENRRSLHQQIGYLAQRFALYGDLTVDENVQFFALLNGVAGWRRRREALLDRVGLLPFRARQADRLSGGMKQKLALACTLIHDPEVLLLDEPTTGVDPVTRREFWRLLGGLVDEGLTLLLATPYLDEAERCSRVILLHRGAVLADAVPATLRRRLEGRVVEVAGGDRRAVAAALTAQPGVADTAVFGTAVHVRVDEQVGHPVEAVREALERTGCEGLSVREAVPGLEDLFLYLTGRADATQRGEAA